MKFLSKLEKWAIRALTRDPNCPIPYPSLYDLTILAAKSEALKATYPDIEAVRGDLEDPTSLIEAVKGVHGIFGVTNFREHGTDAELRQGKALVDAAKQRQLKYSMQNEV